MSWVCAFTAWLFMVFAILLFFHAATRGDDSDPVDFPPERSEIDSWLL